MGKYILVKNGLVDNIVLADDNFLETVKNDYDAIIDWDQHPASPNVGDQAVELIKGEWYFKPVYIEPEVDYIDAEVVEPTQAIASPSEAVEPPAGE